VTGVHREEADVDEVDVVVLGSGAAGLTAALAAAQTGRSVVLFERGDEVGGTTALSGGVCWIPANDHPTFDGRPDEHAAALAYLESLSHGMIDAHLADVLVATGWRVIRWLEATTSLRFRVIADYPDYHPERPGGRPDGGRSLDPGLFDFADLGSWAGRVVHGPENYRLRLDETPAGGRSVQLSATEVERREERDSRGRGQALVGGLLAACLDAGVVIETGQRATELVVEDGVVRGVVLEGADGSGRSVSGRAVVLACGGFEWDDELVRAFLRGPMTSPASVPTNTGDGLRMAMRAGAALGNMREAWWAPVVETPGDEFLGEQRSRLVLRERTLPRSIMVNRDGRRFTNEAANYNALGGAFHTFDPTTFDYRNLPCWLVFDQGYLDAYGFDGRPAGAPPPAWVHRADDPAGLAASIGVDGAGLAASIDRWNQRVAEGADPDFSRGASVYDLFNGDRSKEGAAATLGPLDRWPLYAAEIRSGTLGTKGGPRTDGEGRVLDHAGAPILGLYAAGNAMAGVTGMVYGGAGGTLGPALAFGYRAGIHAATGEPATFEDQALDGARRS
jgi:3-oxosteroid 1-dehydrogenase